MGLSPAVQLAARLAAPLAAPLAATLAGLPKLQVRLLTRLAAPSPAAPLDIPAALAANPPAVPVPLLAAVSAAPPVNPASLQGLRLAANQLALALLAPQAAPRAARRAVKLPSELAEGLAAAALTVPQPTLQERLESRSEQPRVPSLNNPAALAARLPTALEQARVAAQAAPPAEPVQRSPPSNRLAPWSSAPESSSRAARREGPRAARNRVVDHLGNLYTESGQTLQCSFSAVSKPYFASKYALESSRRDLHNALLCTVLNAQNFLQKSLKILLIFSPNLLNLTNFR